MQLLKAFTFLAALGLASASALPNQRATGTCGLDTYNNQYFCIIAGVVSSFPCPEAVLGSLPEKQSYGCAVGTCEWREGPQYPCSGGDGHYVCPK